MALSNATAPVQNMLHCDRTSTKVSQKCHNGGTLIPWLACLLTGPMINEQLSAEQRAELLDKIPVKKFCTPEEIAHTVDYLISPLAGFVTVRCFSLRLLIILLHVHKYH